MKCREVFGLGIRRMMKCCNLTEEELADKTGISIRNVKRFVSGDSFPTSNKVLNALTAYFECEESDILAYGFGLCGE